MVQKMWERKSGGGSGLGRGVGRRTRASGKGKSYESKLGSSPLLGSPRVTS